MSDSQGYDPYALDPHGAVGAYAADALDDDERAIFEQHLAGCESCRQEVAEFTETTAELSWLAATPPPPSLRASVLAEIATVRPLPPEQPQPAPAVPSTPSSVTQTSAPGTPPGPVPTPDQAPVRLTPAADRPGTVRASEEGPTDELAVRRQRRTRRIVTGLVAAALALVVGLGGWVAVLRGDQQAQQIASQQVNDLLTAPDAKVYATTMNGAPVSFVVSKERDQALFLGDDVPAPGDGKAYQLWMIGDQSGITPNAVIERGGDVAQWFDAGPLADAQQLAVTIEPSSGSSTPNLPAVAGVKL